MPLCLGNLLCSANSTPIEVDHASIRRHVREDHAAAAPLPDGMRPAPRRRIAHAELLH